MVKRREICFIAVVIVAAIILALLPTGYENPTLHGGVQYERGRVVKVDNRALHQISIVKLGGQNLELEILSGDFRGRRVEARNELLGDKRRDKLFDVGDRALCVVRVDDSTGDIAEVRAEEHYRQDVACVLVAIFFVALIIFAGGTGAKAVLSFGFAVLAIWKLLIPALLNGYSPLMVSIAIVFLTTSVIILLVGGVSKRGCVALLGSMLGVVVTAGLALLFGHYFKIPGTVQDYSDALIYAGFAELDFAEMFLSCIFISSAGAVMDVAMDIAAAQDELSVKAPHLTLRELIQSGLNIASPVVGSMTTTLLFAYSGSFMFAFMAFMAQGAPMESIVNRGFIAAEILHTMVGSFGLVLVAPITAVLGGYVFCGRFSKEC